MLKSARQLIDREVVADAKSYAAMCVRGFSSENSMCDFCKTHLRNKWDIQQVWLMPCDHVFHARCIAKTDGQCSICFKEYEVLRKSDFL